MELQEYTPCQLSESSVDEEAGVIRGVKILGRVSKRGRRYSDQALQNARELYEGIALNFDHPDEHQPGKVRGFMEQVGCLSNCSIQIKGSDDADGVYGDMEILRSHPGSPMLFEAAKRFPNRFGLSHNAQGDSTPDGSLVESITNVRSVDIVTRPATNAGLFESETEDPPMADKTKKRTVKQILADAPDSKWAKILLEADPVAVPPDMEVETPEEADPAAEIKAALEKAVVAVVKKLFNGEMEEQAAMDEIRKIIGMKDEAAGEGEGDAGGDAAAAMEALNERLTQAEVKNLLLENDVEATPIRVKALSALPENQRAALLESWPKQGSQDSTESNGTSRPKRSPGQNLTEAEDDWRPSENAKDQMARLRRG